MSAPDELPTPSPSPARPPARSNAPTAADLGLPNSVECPFCSGTRTELHAPFGSRLSFATYWCNECRCAFEWLRPEADASG